MSEDLDIHWKEWTESDYLAGWEIKKSGDRDLTIKNVEKKMVHNPRANKKVEVVTLQFTEGKPMVLNKINRKAITLALKSPVMSQWIGQTITLTTEHGTWFGEETDAIRVKTVAPKPVVVAPKELAALSKGTEDWNKTCTWLKANTDQEFDLLFAKLEKRYVISPALKRQLKIEHDVQ